MVSSLENTEIRKRRVGTDCTSASSRKRDVFWFQSVCILTREPKLWKSLLISRKFLFQSRRGKKSWTGIKKPMRQYGSWISLLLYVCGWHLYVVVALLSRVQLFCNPMDCSPSGSSVHGIFWASIVERGGIFFSLGSSRCRDWNCDFYIDSLPLSHLTSVLSDNKRGRQIHKIQQAGKYESKLLPLILWFCMVEGIFFSIIAISKELRRNSFEFHFSQDVYAYWSEIKAQFMLWSRVNI